MLSLEKFVFNKFYQIPGKDETTLIVGALKQLGSKFCVPIKQIPTGGAASGDYVFIRKGGSNSGCFSDNIGRSR